MPGAHVPSWLDLKLSLGNIVTIGTVLVGLAVGWTKVEERDKQQAEAIAALRAADAQRAAEIRAVGEGLRLELREVKAKTDTILEKLVDRQQATTERVVRVETKVDVVDQKLDDLLRRVSRPPP